MAKLRWAAVLFAVAEVGTEGACVGVVSTEPHGDTAPTGHADGDAHAQSGGDEDTLPPIGGDASPVPNGDEDIGEEPDPLSTNPALFFGAARCSDAALLACESFEGGDFDTSTWTLTTNRGAGAVHTDHAARGAGAFRITLETQAGAAVYLRNTSLFPMPNNRFFGRVFMNIQSQPASRSDGQVVIHWNLAEATGPANVQGGTYYPLVRWGGILRNHPTLNDEYFIFNYEMSNPKPPGFGERAKDGPASGFANWLDQWICVEWEYAGNDSEGRLWRDGVEVTTLHVQGSLDGNYITMPQFESTRIGWQHYQPISTGFEVWLDEIALDDQRIGCVR